MLQRKPTRLEIDSADVEEYRRALEERKARRKLEEEAKAAAGPAGAPESGDGGVPPLRSLLGRGADGRTAAQRIGLDP